MSDKKQILKLSIAIALVSVSLVMLLFSQSNADEQAKQEEEVQATYDSQVAEEKIPVFEEETTLSDGLEATTQPEAQESEKNDDMPFIITKKDGGEVKPGVDYSYTAPESSKPGLLEILESGDNLVVGNVDPSTPANCKIQVLNALNVNNLTLKNLNIRNDSTDVFPSLLIYDQSQETKDFDLNIEGECTIARDGTYGQCLDYEFSGDGITNVNINGAPGSILNVYTSDTQAGFAIGLFAYQKGIVNVNIGSDFKLHSEAKQTLLIGHNNNADSTLTIKDNASLDIQDLGRGVVSTTTTLKDNARLSVVSTSTNNEPAILIGSRNATMPIEKYPKFSVLGNASLDARTTTNCSALNLYKVDSLIDTNGHIELYTEGASALVLYYSGSSECPTFSGNFNFLKGLLYCTGYYCNDDPENYYEVGPIEFMNDYSFSGIPEGYVFVGTDELNAPLENLTKEVKIGPEPGDEDAYDTVLYNKETNEAKCPKTVALMPPYVPPTPPGPEPSPDVPESEDISATAQTGDGALPLAVLAIVAVAGAGATFGARKLRKN